MGILVYILIFCLGVFCRCILVLNYWFLGCGIGCFRGCFSRKQFFLLVCIVKVFLLIFICMVVFIIFWLLNCLQLLINVCQVELILFLIICWFLIIWLCRLIQLGFLQFWQGVIRMGQVGCCFSYFCMVLFMCMKR